MKASLTLMGLVAVATTAALPTEASPDVEYIFDGPLVKGGPTVHYTATSIEVRLPQRLVMPASIQTNEGG